MNTYFHINKNNNCNWKTGVEIDFGKEKNHYWQSLSEGSDSIRINDENFDTYKIVTHAYDHYIHKRHAPGKMGGYHFNPIRTLKETINSLGNVIKINRKLLFESIRKEFYPELPSRQKCIWIIPDNEESLEFGTTTIHYEHQKIFKVAVDGNIHIAAQKWVQGGTFSLNKWNTMAHSYWKGEESGSIQDEILFEGRITILEEVNSD